MSMYVRNSLSRLSCEIALRNADIMTISTPIIEDGRFIMKYYFMGI
jgi:hypothetical protein